MLIYKRCHIEIGFSVVCVVNSCTVSVGNILVNVKRAEIGLRSGWKLRNLPYILGSNESDMYFCTMRLYFQQQLIYSNLYQVCFFENQKMSSCFFV